MCLSPLCSQVFWPQFHPTATGITAAARQRTLPRLSTTLPLRLVRILCLSFDTAGVWGQDCYLRDDGGVAASLCAAGYQMPVHSQGDWQSGVMMYMQGDPQVAVSSHQQGEQPHFLSLGSQRCRRTRYDMLNRWFQN